MKKYHAQISPGQQRGGLSLLRVCSTWAAPASSGKPSGQMTFDDISQSVRLEPAKQT